MSALPDPRPEIWLSGDESGSFDFSGRPDDEYFLIVTVGVVGESLRQELEDLAANLRTLVGDPWIGLPFHAKDDTPLTRDRVFGLLATHQLAIDASIVRKSTVPLEFRGRTSHRLYTFLWYHHLIHVLPGILSPMNKVHLLVAELGTYSRKQAFKNALAQATAAGYIPLLLDAMAVRRGNIPQQNWYDVPALVFGNADARQDRMVQIADYCAWAIRRKLQTGEERNYAQIRHLIRSERIVTIKRRSAGHAGTLPKLIGLMSWTGFEGHIHDYELSSDYQIGPADSFQALLATQEALREGNLAQAIRHLELIRPSIMVREKERLHNILAFIGALTDETMPDPALALRATSLLIRTARELQQADDNDVLAKALLATALYNQALALGRLDRESEAVEVYGNLINAFIDSDLPVVGPVVAKALVNKGHALRRSGDVTGSMACYSKVFERFNNATEDVFSEPFIKALGSISDKHLLHPQLAEATYRRAMASGQREAMPRAANNLGLLLKYQGHFAEAEWAFRQAINLGHPEITPWAANNLGWLLREMGKPADAEIAYRSAVASHHADVAPKAALSVGWLCQERGDATAAVAAFQQAIDSGHSSAAAEGSLYLAQLLQRQGETIQALAAFRHALDFNHPWVTPRAAVCLGALLEQMHDTAGAEAAYRQAINSHDADVEFDAMIRLGAILQEKGDLENAEVAYRQAIGSTHSHAMPIGAYHLGVLLEERGAVIEAEAAYQIAVTSSHSEAKIAATRALERLEGPHLR